MVDILKRFDILDCEDTPLTSNVKLLCNPTSERVDSMVYRKMIGLLMYLMNMRLDILFTKNTLF